MGALLGRAQLRLELAVRLVLVRLLMLVARDGGKNQGARELADAYRLLQSRL